MKKSTKMMKDFLELSELEENCLRKSLILRIKASESRWLIRLAIGYLPAKSWNSSSKTLELIRSNLRELLERDVRREFGNPIIIFILVNVIIPIVIRLVMEWWLRRRSGCKL